MSRFYLLIFLLSISFGAWSQQADTTSFNSYKKKLLAERKTTDREFKSGSHSPLADEDKPHFEHLNYYKPTKAFIKKAHFTRFDNAEHFLMKTTTTRLPEYSRFGTVEFEHKGKIYQLEVYQNQEVIKRNGMEKYLFIPFNDLTNGETTYGGGRFLDLFDNDTDTLTIDFNKAYNPYCAYNHKYSCPIPPEVNSLPFKVTAGVKKYHD